MFQKAIMGIPFVFPLLRFESSQGIMDLRSCPQTCPRDVDCILHKLNIHDEVVDFCILRHHPKCPYYRSICRNWHTKLRQIDMTVKLRSAYLVTLGTFSADAVISTTTTEVTKQSTIVLKPKLFWWWWRVQLGFAKAAGKAIFMPVLFMLPNKLNYEKEETWLGRAKMKRW